jgi:hypothetical protein
MLWLLVVIAILAIGAALLALGLRGRIIDDHPHCRRCGFDLVGLSRPADASQAWVCPECGRDLNAAKSIRIGTRIRRRGLIVSGSAILLLLALATGSVIYLATRGTSVYAKLPNVALRLLIPYRSGSDLDAIGQELSKRIASGDVVKEEVSRMVDAALERQADWNRPWSMPLGAAIEAAIGKGFVSDTQLDRYIAQAVRLKMRAREKIVACDEPAISVIAEDRTGYTGVLRMQAHLLDVMLDDKRIDGERTSIGNVFGGPGNGATGSGFPMETLLVDVNHLIDFGPKTTCPPAAACADPGVHTLTTVWALIVGLDNPSSQAPMRNVGWSRYFIEPPTDPPPARTIESIRRTALARFASTTELATWRSWQPENTAELSIPHAQVSVVRCQQKITIIAAGVEPVELATQAPAKLSGAVTVTGLFVQPASPPYRPKPCLYISLSSSSSLPIAGNMFWLVNGEKKPLGSVMFGAAATRYGGAHFPLPTEPECPETVELLIEPDPKVAHRTLDCYRIVGTDVHVTIHVDENMRRQLRGESDAK